MSESSDKPKTNLPTHTAGLIPHQTQTPMLFIKPSDRSQDAATSWMLSLLPPKPDTRRRHRTRGQALDGFCRGVAAEQRTATPDPAPSRDAARHDILG